MSDLPSPLPRSYLYVPGNRPDRLARAVDRGADALIIDLEDAVPMQGKAEARSTVAEWLPNHRESGCEFWIRINADNPAEDIPATITARVAGAVVPKAEPALLADVDQLLTARERDLGLPVSALRILALIETAQGLLDARTLARAPRVHRLGIGEVDLAAELGLQPTTDRTELIPLRLDVVVASAAAGIAAPVAPTSTDFRDLSLLRDSTEALLRLGFRARTAIHPAQVPVINDCFTPSPDDAERARRLVRAFEEAERAGSGVLCDEDGRMVDLAVVRSARETLARAQWDAD